MNGAPVKTRVRSAMKTASRSAAARPTPRTARPRPRAKAGDIGQAPPEGSSSGQIAVDTNGAEATVAVGTNGVGSGELSTPYASAVAVAAVVLDKAADEPNAEDIKATEGEAKEAVTDAQQDDMEGDVIDDPVRMYLREIGRVTLLTAADERRLAPAARLLQARGEGCERPARGDRAHSPRHRRRPNCSCTVSTVSRGCWKPSPSSSPSRRR